MSAYDKAYLKFKNNKKILEEKAFSEVDMLNNKRVMVMGHPYNLYDSYINMDAIDKIKSMGAYVLTPEMIDDQCIFDYAKKFDGRLYWTFARKLVGTALYLIDKKNIDGIIYVSTFGCGVDSVVADIVEKIIRRKSDIPFMLVTLDEHSGEAGINTRIEAFIDMVKWRDISENNISAHG